MRVGTSLDSIINAGNADAYPILRFHGAIEDPVATNLTTDEQLSIDYDVSGGDYIEITTQRNTAKHVTVVTETNVLQYVTGDFLKLAPGSNTIKLDVAASDTDSGCLVAWTLF